MTSDAKPSSGWVRPPREFPGLLRRGAGAVLVILALATGLAPGLALAADPYSRVPAGSFPPPGTPPLVGWEGPVGAAATGKSPGTPSAYPSSPSLYDALSRQGGQAAGVSGPAGNRDPVAPASPGTTTKRYRFRGDGPEETYDPKGTADYHYRPLTSQERERLKETPGWRPLAPSRQEAAPSPPYPDGSPPPPLPMSPEFPPPGGASAGRPPGPEMDNWFDRHYGQGRR